MDPTACRVREMRRNLNLGGCKVFILQRSRKEGLMLQRIIKMGGMLLRIYPRGWRPKAFASKGLFHRASTLPPRAQEGVLTPPNVLPRIPRGETKKRS